MIVVVRESMLQPVERLLEYRHLAHIVQGVEQLVIQGAVFHRKPLRDSLQFGGCRLVYNRRVRRRLFRDVSVTTVLDIQQKRLRVMNDTVNIGL